MPLNPDTLDFSKANGLIAAVIQDALTRQVLMLGWQNPEAVRKTQETGKLWFYSRSRKALWQKGETSGNELRLIEATADCDQDAVLYLVEPSGPACHTGTVSCFDRPFFNLGTLERRINERLQSSPEDSYTARLASDVELLLSKIREESAEVEQAIVEAEGNDSLRWEAADLVYHLSVLLRREGLSWADVEQELAGRDQPKA